VTHIIAMAGQTIAHASVNIAICIQIAIVLQTAIAIALQFKKDDMLKIKSIDQSGIVHTRDYDNNKCKFYHDGKIVVLDTLFMPPEEEQKENPDVDRVTTKEERERNNNLISRPYKSGEVAFLRLQLGMSCNFHCSYCIQHSYGADTHASTIEDTKRFIENFDSWCTVRKEDQFIHIQFWGGEPLLYMEKLRLLIPFFKGRFDRISMTMVTNGSLLTEELVDFFIEYDVVVVVSHDGPTNNINRTLDPLAKDSESLKWIRHYHEKSKSGVGFNSVITKTNPDIGSVISHIKGAVGGDKPVSVGFEGIVVVEDDSHFDDSSLYTDLDYLTLRENIRNLMAAGTLKDVSPFNGKFQTLLNSWFSPDHMICKFGLQKCGMDSPYSLAVTLKGDVLLCHSTNTKIGTVDDLAAIDIHSVVTRWPDKPECNECIVLNLCRGACMAISGSAWFHTCNNEFNFNLAVFEACFEYVFKERIVMIDGHEHRPARMIPVPNGQ